MKKSITLAFLAIFSCLTAMAEVVLGDIKFSIADGSKLSPTTGKISVSFPNVRGVDDPTTTSFVLEGNFGNVRPREGEADTARNIVEREVHRGRICHKGVSLRVVSILHRLLRSGKVVVDYSARNLGTGLIRRKCQDRVAVAHILQAGCAFEIGRRSGGCIQGFEFVSGSAEENGDLLPDSPENFCSAVLYGSFGRAGVFNIGRQDVIALQVNLFD